MKEFKKFTKTVSRWSLAGALLGAGYGVIVMQRMRKELS